MREELSPSQAAERIGATTRSVQRWIANGRLPARRVGSRWRVANDAIDAFIAEGVGVGAGEVQAGSRPVRRPIRAVFIANRGEIVNRIARTCDAMAIRWVAPSTSGPGAVDLLDIDAVVQAALTQRADAIHPGFGFLAENAEFAEAVDRAGLIWVGPPPAAIRTMGDKGAARTLAASLGVPVLAGYDGTDQSDEAFRTAADRIGPPLVVKPAAGGGGKGIRVVRELDRLRDALAAARREARAAFGDERLILERMVEGGRHVEIQVLFDGSGNGVHLGERDCSVQRRHQKVLEEAPSPAVGESLRARLSEAALMLGRAVGYVGAGTCEFLLDDSGTFSFLEMNTRLQVEHPVTECITGRDLVADQLRIATGEPLQIDVGSAAHMTGHAVEVRLYAEDAEQGFLPATGRIEGLRWPTGDGIRVDAGIELGDEIGGQFDPMLAKVIAWGPDRATALDRLARALDQTLLLGIVTNLRFLRWLVRQPVVRDGQVRTDTLDRIWPPDDWSDRFAIQPAVWEVAAAALLGRDDPDPWAGGWRLNATRSVQIETESERRSVSPGQDGHDVELVRVDDTVHVDVAGRSVAFRLARPPDVESAARSAVEQHPVGAAGPTEVRSPMPGSVLGVHHQPGETVDAGDPVVTLEAMKMEHVVTAPIAGRLAELRVRPADQVVRGQILAIIEP